jgi:hypothetical protein
MRHAANLRHDGRQCRRDDRLIERGKKKHETKSGENDD